MGLKEKLEKIGETENKKDIDWEAVKTQWVNRVDELYKKISKWFSDLEKEGYVKIKYPREEIYDEYLGNYYIKAMEIKFANNETIVFEPISKNIMGADGRIDVYVRGLKVDKQMLLLFENGNGKYKWEIWPSKHGKNKKPLTKKNLETLFEEWVLYE
jgi:hypothetical protein